MIALKFIIIMDDLEINVVKARLYLYYIICYSFKNYFVIFSNIFPNIVDYSK